MLFNYFREKPEAVKLSDIPAPSGHPDVVAAYEMAACRSTDFAKSSDRSSSVIELGLRRDLR